MTATFVEQWGPFLVIVWSAFVGLVATLLLEAGRRLANGLPCRGLVVTATLIAVPLLIAAIWFVRADLVRTLTPP